MADTDYMNDLSGVCKEIVKNRDMEQLHDYFFNDLRSGHAKLNAIHECTKELWEAGLEMLVINNKYDPKVK